MKKKKLKMKKKKKTKNSLFFIYFIGDNMKLIAHRANNEHKYKENTLNGILNCLKKDYIDGIEIDIRMTKDNYFVLHHNMTYENHIIENRYLKDLNLDELNNVLKKIKSNKILLLDLKCDNLDYKKYGNNIIKILKKYKLNFYLCSFNYELSKYLKEITNYKIGLFVSNIINKNKNTSIFDFIAYNYKVYKKIKKTIFVWTVNRGNIVNNFKDKDIYIITDNAYKLIKND